MKIAGKITDLRVLDVRFPTSLSLDGSDAMNPDPDYSAGKHEFHDESAWRFVERHL